MRGLYESLLDDEDDVILTNTSREWDTISKNEVSKLNNDKNTREKYFEVYPRTYDENVNFIDFEAQYKCLIFNRNQYYSKVSLLRTITDLHDIINADFDTIQFVNRPTTGLIDINMYNVSDKTLAPNIISYNGTLYFDMLNEIKDINIACISKNKLAQVRFDGWNMNFKNVKIALNTGVPANKYGVAGEQGTELIFHSMEMPDLSGITTNAYTLKFYNPSIFENKDVLQKLSKIIDVTKPITIMDHKLGTKTDKKLTIPRLVAAVNNLKRYSFINMQCNFINGIKLSDVLGLKNFTDINLIKIANNNVLFIFTKKEQILKYNRQFATRTFINASLAEIPVTSDGWYFIAIKN